MTDASQPLPDYTINGDTCTPWRNPMRVEGERMTTVDLDRLIVALDPATLAKVLGPYLGEGASIAAQLVALAERVAARDRSELTSARAEVARLDDQYSKERTLCIQTLDTNLKLRVEVERLTAENGRLRNRKSPIDVAKDFTDGKKR